MPKEQTITNIIRISEDIINLNLSNREIAKRHHVSRHLISKVRSVIHEKNYSLEEIKQMDEGQLLNEFRRNDYPEACSESRASADYMMPDCEYFAKEALRYGLSFILMHEEYTDQCKAAGKMPYQITQFKEYMRRYLKQQEFSEVMVHHPGIELEVDWVGDKAFWGNPDTGEIEYGWMFVGVLSFSGKAYAEVFSDMKEQNWILAHVHMFQYFGGVTRVLVCDNLRTGVLRHPKDSAPVLQKDYEALGNYYGIHIVPGRVATPKDKPLAEATVRFVEDHIVKKLRHSQCFSAAEYNRLVLRELDKLNNRQFEKKEGTRNSCFEKYEKSELKPLPSVPYQFFQKQAAVVQKNCCISYGNNYYSVPYKKVKVGMELSLHIYSDTIEIWNQRSTEKLCEHELVTKGHSYVYVIKSEHMPPKSYRFGDWSSDRFKREAREIGPRTYEVMVRIFEIPPEQKYYKRALAIIALAKKYPKERIDIACQLALNHYKVPTARQIRLILENGEDIRELEERSKMNRSKEEKAYTRGAEYYAKL